MAECTGRQHMCSMLRCEWKYLFSLDQEGMDISDLKGNLSMYSKICS